MAKKLRTNEEFLVVQSVIGEISSPVFGDAIYRITASGQPVVLHGVGGVSYNVLVGHSATRWVGDHVEPGVSVKNKDGPSNNAFNTLSCVGNTATVVCGDAKGARGIVTGKHGGIEHVLVDFPSAVMDKLVIGDKVQVKATGQGLALLDFPQVKVMNVCPDVLYKMGLTPRKDRLECPVARIVPAAVMGSGLGSSVCQRGDYDIQLFDQATTEEYGLKSLRLGDFVAIVDADHSFGRTYRKGAVSVGIVTHCDCVIAGHGPGVTTILSSPDGILLPVVNKRANIADMLGIGACRKTRARARK
ncbi:MAG TPA: DUF4438 domain-containing protein [Candidatus Brocadiia bacterium]|nr:DUF4438 domain-containing protein [Candidatus Brocadiia bacterium]